MQVSADGQSYLDLVGPVSVTGGREHPHALDRLRSGMSSLDWIDSPADVTTPSSLRLADDPNLPEGAYRVEVSAEGGEVAVEVAGGPFSGVIQGVEALLRAADSRPEGVVVPAGCIEAVPALAYRIFWTWDHSTHWDVDTVGFQETGAFNPYGKQPHEFVADYQRMIDFMSRHGVGGVVIYGLLRDSHGGVEAANQICRYARDRGVRILAGFAVNSYGGIYYEGEHPYNLATWLRRHPELAADTASLPGFQIGDYGFLGFPHGDYTMAALSDGPEMEQWHLDGLEWLLGNVEVDGVNLEFGDYAGNDAMADMRRLLPGLIERARELRDDLWLVTELGEWDFIAEPDAAERVIGLPHGCGFQFTYNRSYWPTVRSTLDRDAIERLPTGTNLIRPHAGSQWNRQRYAYMAPHYAELGRLAQRTGLDGASIFGEVSDYSPPNELGYLAFARFTVDETLTWEDFLRQYVHPRLGGEEAAGRFLALLESVDADDLKAEALLQARDEVRSVAAALPDPVRRRWSWLEERLARRIHSRLRR